MPFLSHEIWDTTHIYIWRISESLEELEGKLSDSFRLMYAGEYAAFRSEQRKKEWIVSKILLHLYAGETAPMRYRATGQPYLEGEDKAISVSHTGNYVAIALDSDAAHVGIDVERYGDRVSLVSSRFLNPEERFVAECLSEGDRLSYFRVAWSAKEAVYKWYARKGVDLRTICLSSFVPQEAGILRATICPKGVSVTVHYCLFDDFLMALAVSYQKTFSREK